MKHLALLCGLALPQLAAAHPGHSHATSSLHVPIEVAAAVMVVGIAFAWRMRPSVRAWLRVRSERR